MSRRLARAAGIAALAAVLLGAVPAAAQPKTSVTEVESEVMCPVCGTLLELAESPQALREKAFIKRLVEAGRTKAQIKDALVAQYGDEVLALPQGSGFSLSAYLVPILGFAVAVVALAIAVARWRRSGGRGGGSAPPPEGPSAEERRRLDEDLARYDL
ncbi:MAG: cytochrome c-type biogenesis protein CcmH [Syntrophothermus sp.]